MNASAVRRFAFFLVTIAASIATSMGTKAQADPSNGVSAFRQLSTERQQDIHRQCNYLPGTKVTTQMAQCFAEHLTQCIRQEGRQIISISGQYELKCCPADSADRSDKEWHFFIDAATGAIYDVLPCGTGFID